MLRPLATVALLAAISACEAAGGEQEATPEPTGAAAEGVVSSGRPFENVRIEAPATPQPAAAEDRECGADKLGRWLNVLPTDDVKAEIAERVGERPIRYYTQGDPITMDFSPARLNVELGEDGRIKRFRCG